jgi:hypothetical protein
MAVVGIGADGEGGGDTGRGAAFTALMDLIIGHGATVYMDLDGGVMGRTGEVGITMAMRRIRMERTLAMDTGTIR